jgi:hypothetical protein
MPFSWTDKEVCVGVKGGHTAIFCNSNTAFGSRLTGHLHDNSEKVYLEELLKELSPS